MCIPIFYPCLFQKIDTLIKEETHEKVQRRLGKASTTMKSRKISADCMTNLTIGCAIFDILVMVTCLAIGVLGLTSRLLPPVAAYSAIPIGSLILVGWIAAYIKCGFCRLPN